MRILFMGTPEFAVPSLAALVAAGHEICGVFSQPDKPVGRHQNVLQPTPIKVFALTQNIPVFQPVKLRDGTALALIEELVPDLIVVVAYGRFLPDEILNYPLMGCINVHSSLLPKYRGAAPIHWAVLNGEAETGVTIQHMASEMDTGDIIAQETTPIGADETAEALYARLANLGGALLVKAVSAIEDGTATRTPQDHGKMTLAPMLTKDLSPMDWGRKAKELNSQVRGLLPWPVAVTELGGIRCKIFAAAVADGRTEKEPGTILAAGKDGIFVACGQGTVLRITELQPDGSKRMSAADFLRGRGSSAIRP